MLPLARILVFVEGRAVEAPQAVAVLGEVGRHPVDDHPDPGAVEGVDERHQRLRRPEPARGGEHADRLVAPARRQRVLGGGEQLDVREPHLDAVGDELAFEIGVRQPADRIVSRPPPTAEVDLVGVDRGVEGVVRRPRGHPVGVAPSVRVEIDDTRGRPRRELSSEAVWIGALGDAVSTRHEVFVDRAGGGPGDERLPDTGGRETAEGVQQSVPVVEVADDRHRVGVRCPDGEADACH